LSIKSTYIVSLVPLDDIAPRKPREHGPVLFRIDFSVISTKLGRRLESWVPELLVIIKGRVAVENEVDENSQLGQNRIVTCHHREFPISLEDLKQKSKCRWAPKLQPREE
jgi:hypothetical protein